MEHYNRIPRRRAEFIRPPNTLKAKVGSGGLSDEIIDKAQALLESSSVDFLPLAEMYLDSMMRGIERAKTANGGDDSETLIAGMLYPGMQLKANGGMFHYPLVTRIAGKLIGFLEVIDEPDIEAIEIVLAFYTTIKAVVHGRISGDGGRHGVELLNALADACARYFEKHPDGRNTGKNEL